MTDTAGHSSSSAASINASHQPEQEEKPQPQPSRLCANCSQPEPSADAESPILKACTACKTVLYCSRECKKAHAKTHKKQCAALAQAWFGAHGDEVKMASRAPPKAETYQKGLRKWQFDT